jgi:rubrerythrin
LPSANAVPEELSQLAPGLQRLKKQSGEEKMSEESQTETLNSLLRAELSAAQTYRRLLARTKWKERKDEIELIARDHQEAADLLGSEITALGGDPDTQVSTWRNLEAIIEGCRDPLSDPMAIKALKEGEKQDLLSYERAMNQVALEPTFKVLIHETLLPRTRAHLPVLDKLLAAA